MSGSSSSDEARLASLEVEYLRLVSRWYPAAWRGANGQALVGTLMDAAESRGTSAVTPALRIDLARRGMAVRASTAIDAQTRARITSIAVGMVVAYPLVLVLTSQTPDNILERGSTTPMNLAPSRLGELLPFLCVWLLVAGLAFVRRRGPSIAALALASLVTVASSVAWFDESIDVAIRSGWANWWMSLWYTWPDSIANFVFLFSLALLALLGRPRVGIVLGAAAVFAVVALASLLTRTGRLTAIWPGWFWTPSPGAWGGPISIPGIVALLAVAAMVFARVGRSRWAVALAVSCLPLLLAWTVEFALDPHVYIAL